MQTAQSPSISLDGLIRDTILYHHYHLQTGLAIDGGLDGDNLCFTLAIALVALLGGDIMKIMSANL